MISPAHIQLVADVDGTDLGLREAYVDLKDEQLEITFDTAKVEGQFAFGILIRSPLNERVVTSIYGFPCGPLRLLGGILTVDLRALLELDVADHLTCPECFGTGLKGGFQTACSKGCSS